MSFRILFKLSCLVVLLTSCSKESDEKLLNSFSFMIDGQLWLPTELPMEKCMQAFYAYESGGPHPADQESRRPYYNIFAYQDPLIFEGVSKPENKLEIQVNDITSEGLYFVAGSDLENFQSYARFSVNGTSDEIKVYKNDQKGSFNFTIDSFFPSDVAGLRGIEGSFAGILYNVMDSRDSIIISRGVYRFKKINWNNFNQCAQ